MRGVVVLGVRRGSPAEQAGIRPFDPPSGIVGDIIVGANGQRTPTAADLPRSSKTPVLAKTSPLGSSAETLSVR
jgi:S1-C subfamily serine protease